MIKFEKCPFLHFTCLLEKLRKATTFILRAQSSCSNESIVFKTVITLQIIFREDELNVGPLFLQCLAKFEGEIAIGNLNW